MTKSEFLNLLEQRLMVLNDSERADLLSEYEEHIDMKMESGLSEEEAIAGFGDTEELIKELLDAYHLNTDYQPSGVSATARIAYYVKSCAHFLSSAFDALCHMSIKQFLQLCLRVCGMLLFLGILFMAGAAFCSILRSFLWSMPFQSVGQMFYLILELCLYLIFTMFSIYLFVFFIKRYILVDYEPLEMPTAQNPYPYDKAALSVDMFHLDEHGDNIKNDANNMAEQTGDAFHRMKETVKEKAELRAAKREGKEPIKIPFPDISLGDLCMKVFIFCCRFVAFFFLLMIGCSALSLIAATATGLVFLVMGYQLFGPFLVLLGCTLISVVITGFLLQFVFGIGGGNHETV